ncbi:hypothetical protein [Aporhodopirellula aestuarii]|uniref:Uncharacterized protein n=1 Tax=Aporhodopirellula aestuarii TaxID=2950107 RepID=A0ABT0U6N8_9BACT|nr:hypothetical protein [Aporhodopirellula aestuarii]MCM2372339.1 hypothetical protein [Aporhodopirellula aestuarii]
MKNIPSHLITALAFAVPGAVFAWCLSNGQGPAMWRWIPLSAGIGTFATAIVVWPWVAQEETSCLRCSIAGGVVGMLAHPVTAVVLIVIMSVLSAFELLPPLPEVRASWPTSIEEMLKFATFLVFWWCLLAIFWIGWLTAAIGAILGFIGALVRRWTSSYVDQKQLRLTGHLAVPSLFLLLTSMLSIVGCAAFMVLRLPPPTQDVVVSKSAEHFEGEPNPGDVFADVLTGAKLIKYEDPDGDLSWKFTEKGFGIVVGDSGLPPELMYELGLPTRDVQRIHGSWSVNGQLLFLTNIQVDGRPSEHDEVVLGCNYASGKLLIYAADHYEFQPGS